jgi:hypothetical protein
MRHRCMAAFCARVVREPSQVRRRTHTHTHTHPVQVCPLNLFALHGAPAGPHVCTAGLLSASRHASGVPAAEEAAPGARPRARPANSACAPAAGGLTPTLADQPAPHVAALPFALACTLAQRRPAGPDRGRRSLHAHSGGLLAAPPDSRCSAARLCVSKARRAEFRDAGRRQRVGCLSARPAPVPAPRPRAAAAAWPPRRPRPAPPRPRARQTRTGARRRALGLG